MEDVREDTEIVSAFALLNTDAGIKDILIDHGAVWGILKPCTVESAIPVVDLKPFLTGQIVSQGDPIALSGDTGESQGPHLHFVVEPAGQSPLVPRGGTPVTFLNTVPHPNGLREGTVYVADPYPGCNCAS